MTATVLAAKSTWLCPTAYTLQYADVTQLGSLATGRDAARLNERDVINISCLASRYKRI